MYLVTMDPSTRELVRLEMTPLQIRRFRLSRVAREDARWFRKTLDRESAKLGADVELDAHGRLNLNWR
jgi:poly-gamma-glutamate synthesis protein (capsule biosynthesis protein)